MSRWKFMRGLCGQILQIPLIVFALGILIPGGVGYYLLQRNVERETHEKAVMLLSTYTALQRYTEEELTPKSLLKPSGTLHFTAAEVVQALMHHYEKGVVEIPYRYRYVLSEATDPAHRPDPYESQIIAAFQADQNLRKIEDQVVRDNIPWKVIALPITGPVKKGNSLMPPESSGDPRIYNAQKNQVIGASLIYVPAAFAGEQASRTFWTVLTLVALLSLICAVLLVWRTYKLIAKPSREMLKVSQALRQGDWNAYFHTTGSDELAELAASFQETTRWLRERIAQEEKLRALFQQFIPASVAAEALGRNPESVIEGARQEVTVMVINIRNFKILMEHLPPTETVTTLNEFFSKVNAVIVANKGMVSKYLGDTVVAIFGMPQKSETHPLDAVRAALALPRALRELYIRLDEEFGWQLGIGVGISTGEPIVGQFGSTEHYEYTLLGDVVVEAHWLEELSKSVPEEDTFLISEETYRRVMSDVHVFDMGERTTAAGKSIHAFAVQGMRSEARSSLAA